MGYLFIDTRLTGASSVWWIDEQETIPWLVDARAQEVLSCIYGHIGQIRSGLKGIAIVSGPGRFSSIRVGILYANLLARWYHVPLFEATPDDAASEEGRRTLVHQILSGIRTPQTYVAPIYDREPNITTPHV